jgi:hypothetical protein
MGAASKTTKASNKDLTLAKAPTAAAAQLQQVQLEVDATSGATTTTSSSAKGVAPKTRRPFTLGHFFTHTIPKKTGQAQQRITSSSKALVDDIHQALGSLGSKADTRLGKVKASWVEFRVGAKEDGAKVQTEASGGVSSFKKWVQKNTQRLEQALSPYVVFGAAAMAREKAQGVTACY